MEELGKLLDKYADEIAAARMNPDLPELTEPDERKGLNPPDIHKLN